MFEVIAASVLILLSLCLWVVFAKLTVRSWWSPFAFLSVLVLNIFIIRPILLVSGIDVPYPEYLFENVYADVIRAQLYVSLWLIFLILFYLLRMKNNLPTLFEHLLPQSPAEINFFRLRLLAISLLGVSLLIAIVTLAKFGSYSAVLIAAKLDKAMAGSTFVRQIPGLAMVISAIYLSESLNKLRIVDVFISIICVAGTMAVYYMWGAREAIAIIFLGFVILLSVKSRTDKLSYTRILIGGCLLLIVSTYAYIARLQALGASEEAIASRDLITTICISFHMTRYDSFMLLVRDWDFPWGLRWGYDLLIGNLSAIPRFVWESKPEQVLPGAWFRQLYEPYSINGWPFSVIGEWVISFSYLGVIVGSWVTIYIYYSLDRKYSGVSSMFSFYFLLFFCLTVVQNGSILQFLPEYILWVLPMILIGRFIRGAS